MLNIQLENGELQAMEMDSIYREKLCRCWTWISNEHPLNRGTFPAVVILDKQHKAMHWREFGHRNANWYLSLSIQSDFVFGTPLANYDINFNWYSLAKATHHPSIALNGIAAQSDATTNEQIDQLIWMKYGRNTDNKIAWEIVSEWVLCYMVRWETPNIIKCRVSYDNQICEC